MDIILLKNMGKLGDQGKVVKVKDGYARNYLIPKGFALAAKNENFKRLEEIARQRTKAARKQKDSFSVLKEKIDALSLTITAQVKGEEEIYGSITDAQIIKSLKDEGIEIDKNALVLDEPIKKLGVYDLVVKLHPEVEAVFRVWVVKK
ncbi:MAG: 50S ribosomal protein L9 [Candidatus Omnitrophica bacterium]|nr:50S ribosomal protein L9 [Candidatus Omnitrophota bacterium]